IPIHNCLLVLVSVNSPRELDLTTSQCVPELKSIDHCENLQEANLAMKRVSYRTAGKNQLDVMNLRG
ncbi:MAG: hypothetical protein M3Q07_06360, partial [Pseudobdellovibrionaceae bacterium]|nr:hypothetical protein [Pseudobdellovibrionaceae bacterium]